MRKILIGILLLIGWSAQAQYQQINNGESGLSVRNKLNTMHQQLYNLNVTTQYSSDNASWHSEYAIGDQYIRFSTDLGTTWTDGILISDNIEFQDSINMNSNRIKNLEAAIDANDAVNLQQMLDSLAQVTGADSVRYSWDGDGYLKTYVLGSVTDSTLISDTNIYFDADGPISGAGATIGHAHSHTLTSLISTGADITDNGNGTITIAAGEAIMRTTNNADAPLKWVNIPEATIGITQDLNIIVYADYNNGSPQYAAMQSAGGYFYQNWDKVPFATCVNTGIEIIVNDFRSAGSNSVYKNTLSQLNFEPIRYLGGLAAAEVGTRQLNIGGGAVLQGNDYAGIAPFNTSTGGTFTRYYYTNGSGWTRTTGQTTVSNSQYNDITVGLATLTSTPERWANKWLYYIIDSPSRWILIEGQTAYTSLAAAEAGGLPSVLPPEVSAFYAGSLLVAKIIVSGNETNFVEIQNPFVQTFQTTAASSHSNLSDLQFAATGITYGHINDQTQTIDGQKSFIDSPIVPVAALADSTTKAASTSWVLREISTHQVAYTDSAAVIAVTNVLSDADDLVWNYTQTLPQSISATVKDDSHNHIIGNVDGLQTALDGKQVTITGAASTIDTENLTGNRALISNSSGKVAVSSTVSDTELGYLDGVTSGVQTQLDARQLLTDTVTYDATKYYVDTEVAASVANAVTAASPFGADNRILLSDGTGRGAKVSSASFSGDDVSFVGTATAAPATLSTHLLQKGQVEDGSLDADFNTVSVGGSLTGQWLANGSDIYYNGGNVAIGTTNPLYKLHIEGSLLIDAFNNGGDGQGIFFRQGFTQNVALTTRDWGSVGVSSDGLLMSGYDGLGFMTSTDTYDVTKVRMFIQGGEGASAGNVGIDTLTPNERLEVNGNSRVSGAYQLGSSIVQIEKDGSNNMLFTDAFNTDVSLSDLVGGSSLWTDATTYIYRNSPVTIGSITIPTTGFNLRLDGRQEISHNGGAEDVLRVTNANSIGYGINILAGTGTSDTYLARFATNTSTTRAEIRGDGQFIQRYLTSTTTPATNYGTVYWKTDGNFYGKNAAGTEYQLNSAGGGGTVTSVAAGNGMNFATITGTGIVNMGTPSSITSSSTNSASGATHSHALAIQAVEADNLNDNIISGQTATTDVADGDEFLVSDSGLKRKVSASNLANYIQTEINATTNVETDYLTGTTGTSISGTLQIGKGTDELVSSRVTIVAWSSDNTILHTNSVIINANHDQATVQTISIANTGGTVSITLDTVNTEIDFSITSLTNKTWYYRVVEENFFRASTD